MKQFNTVLKDETHRNLSRMVERRTTHCKYDVLQSDNAVIAAALIEIGLALAELVQP